MYVRLAFAVAAHLEPEILIVDEVLAVGDQEFQAKCLGKLREISNRHRTVLFVSHNMSAIRNMCSKCLYINKGITHSYADTESTLSNYYRDITILNSSFADMTFHHGRLDKNRSFIKNAALRNIQGEYISSVKSCGLLEIVVHFDDLDTAIKPVLGIVVRDQFGSPIFGINNRIVKDYSFEHSMTSGTITCTIDSVSLLPGKYIIDLYLGNEFSDIDTITDAIIFDVIEHDVYGSGKLPSPSAGPVLVQARWAIGPTQ
jgi:lipopolysaccharide transport system ATP-binding protein